MEFEAWETGGRRQENFKQKVKIITLMSDLEIQKSNICWLDWFLMFSIRCQEMMFDWMMSTIVYVSTNKEIKLEIKARNMTIWTLFFQWSCSQIFAAYFSFEKSYLLFVWRYTIFLWFLQPIKPNQLCRSSNGNENSNAIKETKIAWNENTNRRKIKISISK